MINYDLTYNELKDLIENEDVDWLDDAKTRTEIFRQLGKYDEKSTIWRRIVKVYMRLQHNKCAFCERKFESEETGGTREFDVEHFRPKKSVKDWPSKKMIEDFELPDDFPRSTGNSNGYYLLPYHPLNYTVSCKPCNQSFKSNYFPIEGTRDIDNDDPQDMDSEKAYLIYPIGDFDSDSEKIIKYDGVMAVPVNKSGKKYDRARVTIQFFRLNDREEHIKVRAEKISNMFISLAMYDNPISPLFKETAKNAIENLISSKSAHTNCLRSFKKLYEDDQIRATEVALKVQEYLNSGS